MNHSFVNPILRGRSTGIKILLFLVLFIITVSCTNRSVQSPTIIQFVYTSDSHFGIRRNTFQGDSNVTADVVNAAMVIKINTLPELTLPEDSGVNAGKQVGSIDYLINTGDIANREEEGIQSASASWKQFTHVFLEGLTIKNSQNQRSTILLAPGNHDITNTIGFYRPMNPLTDNSSMVGIYNYMFPSTPKTKDTFQYAVDKIHYSKNIAGMHFVFVSLWPDSSERIWLSNDLRSVKSTTPVLLFTHDEPNVESKHFTNPNGAHTINPTDKFENLLQEVFKDGPSVSDPSIIEQREFVAFLKKHRNIKVYFHGNDNENRYYDYKGPDNDIDLKIIQVDSPMKGNYSRYDETKLSFQLVTIDAKEKLLTVRECLWNSDPTNPATPVKWGATTTISLL